MAPQMGTHPAHIESDLSYLRMAHFSIFALLTLLIVNLLSMRFDLMY